MSVDERANGIVVIERSSDGVRESDFGPKPVISECRARVLFDNIIGFFFLRCVMVEPEVLQCFRHSSHTVWTISVGPMLLILLVES
jgi:hypothetical protein